MIDCHAARDLSNAVRSAGLVKATIDSLESAIKKAAERGEVEVIFISAEDDFYSIRPYERYLRKGGYDACIVGQTSDGRYVLKIQW